LLRGVATLKTVRVMNSKANEQILVALQEVVGATLKNWLDEHKAGVLQALGAAVAEAWTPPPAPKRPEATPEPHFLNTGEVAARWQLHPETVRRMLRDGRLPRMYVGRKRLVPLSAIIDCETQGAVPSWR
jgi:excisionase family DNA binding protein